MEDIDNMAFNGLPAVFDDKVQNTELYVQKRIYQTLKFLTLFPVEQNETGLFTNYLNGDVDVSEPLYTNNGIDFNEIKFGQGQTVGGQTLPIGFMYRANTRDAQRGKYDSNLQSFYNAAVVKIADFFEAKYAEAMLKGGRASTATLKAWTSAANVIENEITIDDEMRYDANDNATGYAPDTAIVSRADKMAIEKALRKENYDNSNFNYIASHKIANGKMVFFDSANPGAVIEKYADPMYSIVQTLADDGITATEEGVAIPPAFINVKSEDTGRPQTVDNYIWAESNLNMRDSNGILTIQ
jgi:hypothetical protein